MHDRCEQRRQRERSARPTVKPTTALSSITPSAWDAVTGPRGMTTATSSPVTTGMPAAATRAQRRSAHNQRRRRVAGPSLGVGVTAWLGPGGAAVRSAFMVRPP